MNPILNLLLLAYTWATTREEDGISGIVEALLICAALVIVVAAVTPVFRDGVIGILNNLFDKINTL